MIDLFDSDSVEGPTGQEVAMDTEGDPSEPQPRPRIEVELEREALLEPMRADTPVVDTPTLVVPLTSIPHMESVSSFLSLPLLGEPKACYLCAHCV